MRRATRLPLRRRGTAIVDTPEGIRSSFAGGVIPTFCPEVVPIDTKAGKKPQSESSRRKRA